MTQPSFPRWFARVGVCMALTSAIGIHAKPELFVEAIAFGAKDCTFCHLSVAGGEAVNERGGWLIEERIRRETVDIDVAWLSDRGEEADANRTLEVESQSAAKTATAEGSVDESGPSPRLPLDYTTQWGEWPSYGGGVKSQKYSPLPYVNRNTLNELELAWVWEAEIDTGGRQGAGQPVKATPLMVGEKLFVRTRFSTVVAINAETGEQLWEYDPGTRNGPRPPMFGFSTRGLAYHKQADCADETPCERVILLTSDGFMSALEPNSGEVIKPFGVDGRVDLTKGLRRPLLREQVSWSHPPLVCNDVVVVGSQTEDMSQFHNRGPDWNRNLPLGDVRGFDPVTGKQLWAFKTVPQAGEVGVETWGNESWKWMGNVNVWSTFSCDPELGHVYLPVTAPTDHMYGGNRPGDNLFSTSVVALDIASGTRVWHFQVTHHDIWDYDLPTQPVVADVVVDGEPRKIVAQVTKVGYLFVLDRVTGEPVWPVEERPAPPSTLQGEVASPTQPHPTKPPPFELQGFTPDDMNSLTPELRRRAEELLKDVHLGPLYTPLAETRVVVNPGVGGGANWPGASFDPVANRLFVPSMREPMVARSIPVNAARWGVPYRESWNFPKIDGLPFIRPPWASITAYDLDRGEILWQVPNGDGPKYHQLLQEVKDSLPPLGDVYAMPSILVLPDVLIMGHLGSPSHLKALDKDTGEELWAAEIPGYYFNPTPITYMIDDKQYIAVATGHSLETARVSAFRLRVRPEAPD